MATIFELCSQAAVKIGTDAVSSFDDGSLDADVWGSIWQPELQRYLDGSDWHLNTVVLEPSLLNQAPSYHRYS